MLTISGVSLRVFDRPRAAGPPSPGPCDPPDTVQLSQADPPAAWRALLGTGLESTRRACARTLFGPLGHALGRGLSALGAKPPAYQPPMPPDALGSLPPSRLHRPLLLVHGWHHRHEFFHSLTDKLTAEGSPTVYVQAGRFFADPGCSRPLAEPPSEARVFVSVFSSYRLAPDQAAPELQQTLDAVRGLTGQQRVDVAAHSMGGLATRFLVDSNPKTGIGKLMMVGTPNQGVGMAALTESALEGEERGYDLRWLLDLKDVQPDDRRALEWLRPESALRQQLNSRWEQQKNRLEAVLHVGTDHKLTPSNHLLPTRGDALVAASSLQLEGLPIKLLSQQGSYGKHAHLLWHPECYLTMRDYFGWS